MEQITKGPIQPLRLGPDSRFQFRCHKDVKCFTQCCRGINIILTPYDIIGLKNRLGLSSGDFLAVYTELQMLEKTDVPVVTLKLLDEEGTPADRRACPFVRDEGCIVYEDRPTACRYYPVALLSMRRQDETTDRDSYAMVKEPHCLGHQEPRELTIDAYRAEQGLPEYDELARGWRQLILKKKSSGPTIGKPSKRSLQLFFMACYDLDRFRAFVASDGFAELFDLPADEMQMILTDDTALMLFGFRFLHQTLFGEVTIPVRQETAEQRRTRFLEKRARLERDAAERSGGEPGT